MQVRVAIWMFLLAVWIFLLGCRFLVVAGAGVGRYFGAPFSGVNVSDPLSPRKPNIAQTAHGGEGGQRRTPKQHDFDKDGGTGRGRLFCAKFCTT